MDKGVGSFSTRLSSDCCAYNLRVKESTNPLEYRMYSGKYVNDNRCRYDNKVPDTRYDVVEWESELRGITRPASLCPEKKYIPGKKKGTFSEDIPKVFPHNPRDVIGPFRPPCSIKGSGLPPLKNIDDINA